MDTMEWTKIIGGLCGALLIFLLINLAVEPIYAVGSEGGEETSAYSLAVEEAAVVEVATTEPALDDLLAVADAARGAKAFSKCKACHKVVDGANGVGPFLFGVFGRAIGSADGYRFSDALAGREGDWDAAALDGFLENPKGWAPGTKMGFKGVAKPEDRANLIAYLQSLSN